MVSPARGHRRAGQGSQDSPLLGETLDTLDKLGPLPERISVHLDRGYDSEAPAGSATAAWRS